MTNDRPLEGLRVVEMAWVWSGPMVAHYLSDLGAEVIKVEHNDRLDNARLRGRPQMDGEEPDGPTIEVSPYFQMNNRGKKSITVNTQTDRGLELLKDLISESDILVENYSAGAMERIGLGYDELANRNQELIMLSMSPAGQYGALSSMRAYAPIMSSLAGIEGMVGYEGETPIGMLTFGFADPNSASQAVYALLAALYEREKTGEGQYIDFSQYESQFSVLGEAILETQLTGESPKPAGNTHQVLCPYGAYPTQGKDRWVAIAVCSEVEWEQLAAEIDQPWTDDEQFRDAIARRENEDALDERIGEWTQSQTREAVVERLQTVGVAASPVHEASEVLADDGFHERGLATSVDHKYLGEQTVFRIPWQFSDLEHGPQGPAPILGEHNEEVFEGILGLSSEDRKRLEDDEIIY